MSAFSDNLTKYREKANISRKELAAILGVSVASIGFYETGRNEPDLQKLVTIAAALHVSVDDLLGYHVDDFDKAAALFHESTGETATLNGESVTFSGGMASRWKWQKPISKAAFLQAMNECLETFNKETRPRLLKDTIINRIDTVYRKENPVVHTDDAYRTAVKELVRRTMDGCPEAEIKRRIKEIIHLEAIAHPDTHPAPPLATIRLDPEQKSPADDAPPAPDHDNADDEKAKEKGPHSNE